MWVIIVICKINESHETDEYGCLDCFYNEAYKRVISEIDWE